MRHRETARPEDTRSWAKMAAVIATGAVLALGACNTMEGAGQDMQAAGSGLEREAEEAQ